MLFGLKVGPVELVPRAVCWLQRWVIWVPCSGFCRDTWGKPISAAVKISYRISWTREGLYETARGTPMSSVDGPLGSPNLKPAPLNPKPQLSKP